MFFAYYHFRDIYAHSLCSNTLVGRNASDKNALKASLTPKQSNSFLVRQKAYLQVGVKKLLISLKRLS